MSTLTGDLTISGQSVTTTVNIASQKDTVLLSMVCTFNDYFISKQFTVRDAANLRDVFADFREYVVTRNRELGIIERAFTNRGFTKVVSEP